MSRAIKFRAWCNLTKRVYPVAVLSFGHGVDMADVIAELVDYPLDSFIDGKDGVLMQFTGLLDAHGKEIFEGDILKLDDATAQVVYWEVPPEFGLDYRHNEQAWCDDWNLADDAERMEIIGNVYEHPELLK